MAAARRLTAAEAIRSLQVDEFKLLENGSNANYNYVETSLALAATNA